MTSSDAAAVQYGYDGLGRLSSIQYGSQPAFGFAYDALGRLGSLTRPNGVTDIFRYSPSGDLAERDASLNGTILARFDYGIDSVTGRRMSLTDNSGIHSFGYYDNGRLQSATHPSGSGLANESYTYDAAGNRSSGVTPSSYDAADRLQSDGTFPYVSDPEGNLKSKIPVGGGAGTTYNWNADHQLLEITYPDGSSSTYRYDPFGRRIGTVDNGQEGRFTYDGLSVHADYNSRNQLQSNYVGGLEVISQGQPNYYLADGLGSVRALTNSSGVVVGSYAYDSFGLPMVGNAQASRETFTGYQHDSASSLYYAGARYYDPTTGRFMSEDPIPAANPYPYAAYDPVDFVDLFGMQAAAEYAGLLQARANATCISRTVQAIAKPAFEAVASALVGGVPTAQDVDEEIMSRLAVNSVACAVGGPASTFRGGVAIGLGRHVAGRLGLAIPDASGGVNDEVLNSLRRWSTKELWYTSPLWEGTFPLWVGISDAPNGRNRVQLISQQQFLLRQR